MKIVGIIIAVIGIACVGTSMYIKNQVLEGQKQIASAEKKVEQAGGLFSMVPEGEAIEKPLKEGAERKIALGKEEVRRYTIIANNLQYGGIIAIALGVILFIFGLRRR